MKTSILKNGGRVLLDVKIGKPTSPPKAAPCPVCNRAVIDDATAFGIESGYMHEACLDKWLSRK